MLKSVKQLIEKGKKAEELARKLENLQEYLTQLNTKKLKGILAIQEYRRSPSEYSNELTWVTTYLTDYINYNVFETWCTEELKRQLEENIQNTKAKLEELIKEDSPTD